MFTPTPADGLEFLRRTLELLGQKGKPFIIVNPLRATERLQEQLDDIAQALGERPDAVLAIPAENLRDLFIFLAPDQEEAFLGGKPVVIAPVSREDVPLRTARRPVDTAHLTEAKAGLAVETFRLVEIYATAELARNKMYSGISRSEAEDRAKLALGGAMARDTSERDETVRRKRIDGLIDKGRRLAAAFFGTVRPKDRPQADAQAVARTLDELGPKSDRLGKKRATLIDGIQAEALDRAGDLAKNVERITTHERTMAAWSAAVRADAPIAVVDGMDLCSAIATRMSAPSLMRLAIAADVNPAETHRNLATMRTEFELGRQIGRLERGQPVMLDRASAVLLRAAIQTMADGQLTTEADGCNWLLADEALKCRDLPFWTATLDRICQMGVSEEISPKIPAPSLQK